MSAQQNNICKHYDDCGGCSLQHLNADEYKQHKRGKLLNSIQHMGLNESIVDELAEIAAYNRRRVEFKIQINKGDIKLGFYQKKSHEVVDIEQCPVTQNDITVLIPALKLCISALKKPGNIGAINITNADNGLDIIVIAKSKLITADREEMVKFARKNNVLRLSAQVEDEDFEKIYQRGEPIINVADNDIKLPIGAFLQATKHAQNVITEIILENLQGNKNIADLYCGCGTYSFPLAKLGKRVIGYEGASDMVMAMYNATSGSSASASIRDLYKQPLKTHELRSFDAVIINPPRNGALPQVEQLAQSEVSKIIMVSCNPATFERDGQCLLDAGYKLTSATPIDQFLWSDHLELVAVFER